MKTKPNFLEEAINSPISEKNNIDTVNKTEKSQSPNKAVDATKSNKTEKVKPLDKSRSTKITNTKTQ